MRGKRVLVTLTGAAADEGPLDGAPEATDAQLNAPDEASTSVQAFSEAQLLRDWLKFCRMHRLDASDGGLQQRLMPALGRLLAGGDPDECVKALHLISDFIAASRPVEQRKPAVPLRAGGELVGALNEVALNQLMPRLRALSTTNGSH